MGSGASVDERNSIQSRSRVVAALMSLANKPHHAPLVAAKTQWRIAAPYAGTASEPTGMEQELLAILNDPVGQKHIGAYAKKIMTAETFFAGLASPVCRR